MGIYLNPGKQSYQMAVNSEIFVDKTEMIRYLNSVVNTQQRYVSVSRPRRFGKTMAADMICAYYDREADSRELFAQRKLADVQEDPQTRKGTEGNRWDEYLGKFDVIHLVMTDFMEDSNSVQDMLNCLTEEIVDELRDKYTNRQFVIVIDEWDAIFRAWKNDTAGQIRYLDFLRDWMKDKPYVALAYLTGILPIEKYG